MKSQDLIILEKLKLGDSAAYKELFDLYYMPLSIYSLKFCDSFDQAEDICDLLKEKQSVIVNLEYVNKDVARRIIDVVSGAVHALDGHIQKVSNSIFLIAPYNYEITNEMAREEIKNKLSVSWLKNAGNN